MIALGTLLATLAFALFGLATHEHWRKRLARPLDVRAARSMRLYGWIGLATAFSFAVAAQGWVFGPIAWVAMVMFGAGVVFLALNFLPIRKSH